MTYVHACNRVARDRFVCEACTFIGSLVEAVSHAVRK